MSFAARLKKATLIFVGQGMSSFGVKTCGDYLYSGHTCTLILATHFINECKLKRIIRMKLDLSSDHDIIEKIIFEGDRMEIEEFSLND